MTTTFEQKPLMLKLHKKLTDDEFFEFCQTNRDWRIERSASGEILIMPPTGLETGGRNFDLIGQFFIWVKRDGTGKGFDSSSGFTLPNNAVVSPDVSWVKLDKWNALTPEEKKKFALIVPDFVIELKSPSDSLSDLKEKMQQYIDNGVSLAWLIHAEKRQVYVYSAGVPVVVLNEPASVSGEPVLPGFVLDLQSIW
ncbi:Uma2 family endonuclease [Ancylothrix sp. C2]|uniref:Uma2 family endonuclease n=1 Tax=Ancylothrix sp. D3o TaxID=2953691 RepID=UPI0021BA9758|nr:Uma2 family endonuclease [Ancylothrix sp. D3o]MCT7950220.1 Uma2 family endonuclease [Ancylothrix sp. D3o]